jgi:hypothetical protein
MKITIEFNTETAAFEDNQFAEVDRILKLVGEYAYEHMLYPNYQLDRNINKGHKIVDTNGNTIGKFKIVI